MARTMSIDAVDIYRMVVDVQYDNGYQRRTVYGPHDTSAMAKDYSDRFKADNPKRLIKQVLGSERGGVLVWSAIKTEYRNGGEGVSWSDGL